MSEPVIILREPFFERQIGEGSRAWQAFTLYRDQGETRSMVVAYRAHSGRNARKESGQWRVWSQHWRWTDRAAAWDAHLDTERRGAQEEDVRREGERIARERREQRVKEADVGARLIAKALEMLMWPTSEQTQTRTGEDGVTTFTTIVKPGKWRLADAAAMARVGVELRRLSLDMETSRQSVRVDIEQDMRRLARERGFDEDEAVRLALELVDEAG